MKTVLLTLALILSVTATAQARLGETADQLVARYGEPLSEIDQKAEGTKVASAQVMFQKGGIQIDVTLTNGLSVEERFKKLNGDTFTIGEVRILLADNSQGHDWEAPLIAHGEKLWERDDNSTAQLTQDGTFIIKSRELAMKEALAKKLENQPSLEGF